MDIDAKISWRFGYLGREITYENISSAAMLEGLLGAGINRPYAEFLNVILDFFRQGYSERTTDSVLKILGRNPIRFAVEWPSWRSSRIRPLPQSWLREK